MLASDLITLLATFYGNVGSLNKVTVFYSTFSLHERVRSQAQTH